MFKDIKSHRLVSIQFLSAVNLFFGRDVQLLKDTITELYKNMSLRTLRGEQQIDFDKISNLTAHINFKMKIPSCQHGRSRQGHQMNNQTLKDMYEFFKKPFDEDNF